VWQSLVEILGKAILDGRQIDDVALTTTAVAVPHKLGRKARGYVVVGSTVATPVADENAGKTDLDKYVWLKAGASTTCSIWVY
jgi:hypothetical protein